MTIKRNVALMAATVAALVGMAGCGLITAVPTPEARPHSARSKSPSAEPSESVPPPPSETPTPEPSPTPAPTTAAPPPPPPQPQTQCYGDPGLPDGIDPRVCGPLPADVVNGEDEFGVTFGSPSGNILCDVDQYGTLCAIENFSFPPASDPNPNDPGAGWWSNAMWVSEGPGEAGFRKGDVMMAQVARMEGYLMTLGYGKAVAWSPFACISQELGVTCWNAETGHGFFLSKESYSTW